MHFVGQYSLDRYIYAVRVLFYESKFNLFTFSLSACGPVHMWQMSGLDRILTITLTTYPLQSLADPGIHVRSAGRELLSETRNVERGEGVGRGASLPPQVPRNSSEKKWIFRLISCHLGYSKCICKSFCWSIKDTRFIQNHSVKFLLDCFNMDKSVTGW